MQLHAGLSWQSYGVSHIEGSCDMRTGLFLSLVKNLMFSNRMFPDTTYEINSGAIYSYLW